VLGRLRAAARLVAVALLARAVLGSADAALLAAAGRAVGF
jgi:hypothetical protein